MSGMKIKITTDRLIFNIVSYTFIIFWMVLCIGPFWLVISSSFTDNAVALKEGFSLIPQKFSLEGYILAFKSSDIILRSYLVSIALTLVGTCVGVFFIAMTGYALNRMDKELANKLAFFFYFTTMFGGGLIPWYILYVRYLHLKDNFLAMLLPLMFNVFYILIMRSFAKSIPDEISESAFIDGAGEFTIFLKIILPLMKPAIATIGLYLALAYWNNWFNAMLFIESDKLYPLQYMLYSLLNKIEALNNISSSAQVPLPDMPTETMKFVVTVITIGPIVLAYPLAQKYFVQGLTIGAVKG